MPTFIRLASLTEQGIKNIRNFKDMLAEARDIMEQHGVRLSQGWATLGDYDVVAVIDQRVDCVEGELPRQDALCRPDR
jgi:uncharacterized protein with GYD domain